MTLTNRAHFFGVAATLMRQILVDYARRQRADKRGGGVTVLSVDQALPAAWTSSVDVLALDEALDALSAIDSQHRGAHDRRGGRSARRLASDSGARMGLGKGLALSAIVIARVTAALDVSQSSSDIRRRFRCSTCVRRASSLSADVDERRQHLNRISGDVQKRQRAARQRIQSQHQLTTDSTWPYGHSCRRCAPRISS
jgi:hypothetical protein